MFKLLPQLLVIASIVCIILVVFRRLPAVTIVQEDQQEPVPTRGFQFFLLKLQQGTKKFLFFLWRNILEAKDITVRGVAAPRLAQFWKFHDWKTQLLKKTHLGSPRVHSRADSRGINLAPQEQFFLDAIKSDPGNRGAYEGLGKLYLDQKKFQDAAEVYEFLSTTYPDNDGYFSKLGLANFHLGDYQGAIKAYSAAVRLRPEATSRLVNLSLCFEARGELDSAIETLKKALVSAPHEPQYQMLLADYLVRAGQKDEAKKLLETIVRREPANKLAFQKLMQLKF